MKTCLMNGVKILKATAKAHTNIALIKYWGKRNDRLILPTNSSLSVTLDRFYTVTTVDFDKERTEDVFYLNGELAPEKETKKVSTYLNKVREFAGVELFASVFSENHVPTAAGFASSASGYAALSAASTKAIGLNLTPRELSQFARIGSGSACRSIYGGYVEWQMGEKNDGSDSYAVPLLDGKEFPIAVLSVMVNASEKKVLSREGMKRTVETSPFYQGWLESAEKELVEMKHALTLRDFTRLGTIAEKNALKMHATTLGANPPFLYWQSGTLQVMDAVENLRSKGLEAYFTIDAGPNVKVLCQPSDVEKITAQLKEVPSVQHIYPCQPGPGVTYLDGVHIADVNNRGDLDG